MDNIKIMEVDLNNLNKDYWANDPDMINHFREEIILLMNYKKISKDYLKTRFNKFPAFSPKKITVNYIQNEVCKYFDLTIEELHEVTRKQEIVKARQIAMYLSDKLTKKSLKNIGVIIGGKDHSTVVHAKKVVKNLMETEKDFREIVHELENIIK